MALVEQCVQKLYERGIISQRVIVIDSTLIKGYSRPKGDRRPSDPEAAWGFSSTGEKVFGYKLHLACDPETELPLAYEITSANVHDGKIFPILLKKVKRMGLTPRWVVADAGYDSMRNRSLAASEGMVAIIPVNPRNKKEKPTEPGLEWRVLYNQRTAAERIFSRLKEELCLKMVKVRGQWRIAVHVALSLLAMLVVAITAVRSDKTEFLTSINAFRF